MEDSGLFMEYLRDKQSPIVIKSRYDYTVVDHEAEKMGDMAENPLPERM